MTEDNPQAHVEAVKKINDWHRQLSATWKETRLLRDDETVAVTLNHAADRLCLGLGPVLESLDSDLTKAKRISEETSKRSVEAAPKSQDVTSSEGSSSKILHTEDVAKLLGMHVQMVRKGAREGSIPAHRLPGGRKFYFFEKEILDWLKWH